jgi:hypothetical protein
MKNKLTHSLDKNILTDLGEAVKKSGWVLTALALSEAAQTSYACNELLAQAQEDTAAALTALEAVNSYLLNVIAGSKAAG